MKLKCLLKKYYRSGMRNPVKTGDEFEVNETLGTTILQDYQDGFAIVGKPAIGGKIQDSPKDKQHRGSKKK